MTVSPTARRDSLSEEVVLQAAAGQLRRASGSGDVHEMQAALAAVRGPALEFGTPAAVATR